MTDSVTSIVYNRNRISRRWVISGSRETAPFSCGIGGISGAARTDHCPVSPPLSRPIFSIHTHIYMSISRDARISSRNIER